MRGNPVSILLLSKIEVFILEHQVELHFSTSRFCFLPTGIWLSASSKSKRQHRHQFSPGRKSLIIRYVEFRPRQRRYFRPSRFVRHHRNTRCERRASTHTIFTSRFTITGPAIPRTRIIGKVAILPKVTRAGLATGRRDSGQHKASRLQKHTLHRKPDVDTSEINSSLRTELTHPPVTKP